MIGVNPSLPIDIKDSENEGEVGLSVPIAENAGDVGVPAVEDREYELQEALDARKKEDDDVDKTGCEKALTIPNERGLGACDCRGREGILGNDKVVPD